MNTCSIGMLHRGGSSFAVSRYVSLTNAGVEIAYGNTRFSYRGRTYCLPIPSPRLAELLDELISLWNLEVIPCLENLESFSSWEESPADGKGGAS